VKCRHPDAEAVRALGCAGLPPTSYPWMQALIRAFKPTDIVDLRRIPRAEARAIDEEIRHLGGGEALAPAASKAAAREAALPQPDRWRRHQNRGARGRPRTGAVLPR
jgi:hypothetical protein